MPLIFLVVLALGAGHLPKHRSQSASVVANNSAPAWVNAKSTAFDGSNDYVTIGQPVNLDITPNAGEVTISLWFKPTSATTEAYLLAKARPYAPLLQYVMAMNSGSYVGGLGNTSGGTVTTGWQHFVLVVRNISGTYTPILYFNGAVIGSNFTVGAETAPVDWLIGATRNSNNTDSVLNFAGNIDEVTFWNTAFLAANVTALYNAGAPNNPAAHSLSANLIHYYRMGDDDTYPTVTDRVGTAHGTCTDMTSGAVNFVSVVP